jgi:hypothetical protein
MISPLFVEGSNMDVVYGILAGVALGGVGGYMLATHIHSIANAAAARVAATANAATAALDSKIATVTSSMNAAVSSVAAPKV